MFDSFWRAQDLATLRTVIRSAPFRNIIGDLREPDGPGFIQIPGSVIWIYKAPNRVVITPAVRDGNGDIITPAVTDPWCWMQLRLHGDAEAADDEGENGEPDKWNRSRIKRWMKENGTLRTIWGVTVYEHTLNNGKRIQIWRGAELEALGKKPCEYLGGNFY